MRSFKDSKDRSYNIIVNANTTLEVRNKLDFDLTKIYDPAVGDRLSDFVLLVDVVYLLVRTQCELSTPVITPEEFGESMVGDALVDAVEALWKAVSDFFPSRLRAMMTKMLAAGSILEMEAAKKLEGMTPEMIAASASKIIERQIGLQSVSNLAA